MSTMPDTRYTQDRELSWLRFNQRVLEEAADESVPLMERLKFISIFTSNLDEFFMIRVGSLYDMTFVKEPHIDSRTGKTPAEQLSDIFAAAAPLCRRRDKIFREVENRLRSCNVCRLTMEELTGKERREVERWFETQIMPVLSPQVVDLHHPFPHLPSKSLNIAMLLSRSGRQETSIGIVPLPQALPRFYLFPQQGPRYILTEDVLLELAPRLFDRYTVTKKAVISVTRNADINPEDEIYDVEEDYRQLMRKIVRKRARLAPVRLEIHGSRDERLMQFFCERLHLSAHQVFYSRAPLVLDYVFQLPGLLSPEAAAVLCDPPFAPQPPACLAPGAVLPQALSRDLLLFYPFEQMDPFLRLIREAAVDPHVLSIKITIYRLAAKAKLAEYLCRAAENGKDVTVVMELRARFDEQNNIQWAERMEEAGCTLLYGSEGIKVHSKLCLITRREHGRLQSITQVGTGNYNEKTARMYTDLCLITANPAIGADAAALFQNMATGNLRGTYQHLLVSPYALRDRILDRIDQEIARGQEGFLFFKLNSLTDRKLIDKLAQASQAGVEVVLNIRGICCLLPGLPGLTEHIRVFSIVGRYLEHSRIYQFGRGADAALYISSADFMTRNTERRVELACPVWDPACRARLFSIIDTLRADTAKARRLGADGLWYPIETEGAPVCSQEVFQQKAILAAQSLPAEGARPRKPGGWLGRLCGLVGR